MANAFDKIIDNPKRAIALAILVVLAVVLLVFFWKKIKNAISGVQTQLDNNKLIKEEIAVSGVSPSYSDAQFRVFAQDLYGAMKGWGTNEEKIYNVFRQMKSKVDVLKLIDAYGTRDGENLFEWLDGDLSSWNFRKINQILRDNNIDYEF